MAKSIKKTKEKEKAKPKAVKKITQKPVAKTEAKPVAKKTTVKVSNAVNKVKVSKVYEEKMFQLIKDRALRLWHEAGCPEGNDWDLWFKAEAEVKGLIKKI